MASSPFKKILIQNSLSGLLQSLISSVLIFLTIPIFINKLGSESYGIFSLTTIIGNLNVFVNLGLSATLIKFLAEQGKGSESDYDIVVTSVLLILILLPFTIIAIIFKSFIIKNILNIPVNYYDRVKWLYIFLLLSSLIILLGQNLSAILDSQQKILLTNMLQSIYNFIYWGLILLVLIIGFDLPTIGFVIFISSLIWFIAIFVAVRKIWGKINFKGTKYNFFRIAKKQLRYGIEIYTGGVIGFFYEPFSKLLISHFFGTTHVGFFDIALKIKAFLWGLLSKILYPLYPLISGLKDKNKIRFIIHDIEQKLFYLVVPLVSIIAIITKPVISVWISRDVDIISISTICIVIAHLISITLMPNYQFLIAKQQAAKTIFLQSINVIASILIFFISYPFLGYYGIILGNVGSILFSFFLSLYFQKKYLNSLVFDSFLQIGSVVFVLIVNLICGYFLARILPSDSIKILALPIVLSFTTIILYRYLHLFKTEDILRYLGNNEKLYKIGVKVLCMPR